MKNKLNFKENGKKLLALLVAVLVLVSTLPFVLAAAAEYIPADFEGINLLEDGGFENGSYRRGSVFLTDTSASSARSGTKSVYGKGNGTLREYTPIFTSKEKTVEGKKYSLSGWVRSDENITKAAFLQYTAGTTTKYSAEFNVSAEWQYISMIIEEFPADQDLSVGIGVTANVLSGAKVWFDDLCLIEINSLVDTGIIEDGGFEDKDLFYGNENFVKDTKPVNAHTGIASLRAIANGTEQKYADFKTVTVKCDLQYELGIWARSDKELTSSSFGFTGNYLEKANSPIALELTEKFTVNKEWKYYSLKFTAPQGEETVDLKLGLYVTAEVDEAGIWFDDFTLNEVIDYGLIQNGHFEENAIGEDPFSSGGYYGVRSVTNTEAHRGSNSLHLGATDPANRANSIYISLPQVTRNDKTYMFSAYIKVNSVKANMGSGADVYAKFTDENNKEIKGDYYNNFKLLSGTTEGEWVRISTTFAGVAVKSMAIFVYSDDAYIDDMSLVETDIPLPTYTDTGFIEGGDFESGVSAYKQGVWEEDKNVYFADLHSLKTTGAEGEQFFCKGFKIDDTAARYRFSVYIKTDAISTRDGVSMWINVIGPKTEQGVDKDYGWYKNSAFNKKIISTGGTKDWMRYTFIVDELPEDTTALYAYLRTDAGITGTAWFDNFSAVKLETGELTGDMTTFPAPGVVDNFTKVFLEYGNYDVSYKFTLDGSDPKTSDTAILYNANAGITITGKKTIKAYAVPVGYSESKVYSFDFIAPDVVENCYFNNGLWDKKQGNWTYNTAGYAEVSGDSSERMILTSKAFEVNSEMSYILSIKAKGTSLEENTAGAYITLANSEKGEISELIYNFNDKLITLDKGTTDWKTYTAEFKDFESHYDIAYVNLWYDPDKGAAAFDDIILDVSQTSESAFSVTGYTNKLSNIYYGNPDKEPIQLKLLLENLTPIKVNDVKVHCLIYDVGTGDVIAEQSFEYPEIDANASLTQDISMVAATYYGVFLVKAHVYDSASIDQNAELRVARVPEVESLNSYIGINTHVSSSDEEYMKKTIDYITAIGGEWIADEFTWATCEKVKGQVVMLKEYHNFVDYCEEQGVKIRLNVKITHPFYDNGKLPYTEEAISALINYVTIMARTFKGRIHVYEIAGEYDDQTGSSPEGTASPQIYAKILERCYTAIKAEDPDAMVIHGATLRRVKWLEEMFEAGGEPYTDALVIHPYTYWNNQSPYPTMGEWIEGFIDIAERWCPEKKIWITEYGWATADYYAEYSSFFETGYLEKTAAANFVQMYLYSKKYPQIENIMMYDIYDDGTDITNREHNFGLLTHSKFGNLPKAGYAVYPIFSNQLRDIVYEKDYEVNKDFAVFQYKLPDGKKIVALWNLATDDIDDRVYISTKGFSDDAYGIDSYSNEFGFDASEDAVAMILGRTPKFIVASEVPDTIEILSGTDEKEENSSENNQNLDNTYESAPDEFIEYTNTETPLFAEKDDEIGEDEEEFYEKVIVRKRRRKVSDGIPYWVWIIVAVGGVLLAGGVTATIVLIRRKKKNKS